jgi:hypothetical protein
LVVRPAEPSLGAISRSIGAGRVRTFSRA